MTTTDELLHWAISGHLKITCLTPVVVAYIKFSENDYELLEVDGVQTKFHVPSGETFPLMPIVFQHILGGSTFKPIFFVRDDISAQSVRHVDCSDEYEPDDIEISREDLVVMAEDVARMEVEHPELLTGAASIGVSNDQPNKPISPKAERTDLHIIGGMLELLLGVHSAIPFKSEATIITALVERCQGMPGITKRTLEGRFAEAKRAINATE